MKITIQGENNEVSVTLSDDATIDELGGVLKGLLVAWGYHPNNLDDLFNLERWNYERE